MIKYVPEDTSVTFSEIPDEICLCINISNCPHKCSGCHSTYLQTDVGVELTENILDSIIANNEGTTCTVFMGGDSDKESLKRFGSFVKSKGLKSAWYSGESSLSFDNYKEYFDYIKVGPYIKELGPLNSNTTNQRMYSLTNGVEDITYRFWK